jgi:hypothetical protein
LQPYRAVPDPVTLHRERAIDQCQDDVAIDRLAGPVDDRDIAGKDASAGHALALDANRESGGRMLDQQLVEIERPVDIVLGRRRKPAGRRPGHHRDAQRRLALDGEHSRDIAALACPGKPTSEIGERRRQAHHLGRRSRTTPGPCPASASLLSCFHYALL